jgi:hypothetical protein
LPRAGPRVFQWRSAPAEIAMTISEERLIRNWPAVSLMGLLAGLPPIYSLLGGIVSSRLSVTIPGPMPGEPGQWRALHSGSLMHGFIRIIVALTTGYASVAEEHGKLFSRRLSRCNRPGQHRNLYLLELCTY